MNTGIVIPHLGSAQMSFEAINLVNKLDNAVLFFEQLVAPCIEPKCATMCVNELMSFRGTLITTNISNTIMASKLINKSVVKHIFYVWDLEWLRPNKNNFLYNLQAYKAPQILVARSQEHVNPIANYCNRIPIVKSFEEVLEC